MFYIKKIISFFTQPLPVSFLIAALLVGILVWKFSWTLKKAVILFIPLFFAGLMSCHFVGNFLTGLIETEEHIYTYKNEDDFEHIVVLGHGHQELREGTPAMIQLSDTGMKRIAEAWRIKTHFFPDAKIIVCGSGGVHKTAYADIAQKALMEMGINSQEIITLNENTRDTIEEAKAAKDILGDTRFLLVTSALHMPRALYIFKELEMNPSPAATDFLSGPERSFLNASGLRKTERAVHEFLGINWARLIL